MVFHIGVFAPGVIALVLERLRGRALSLLRPLVRANVAPRWFAFALLFMLAIKLTGAVVHRMALGRWPVFVEQPLMVAIPLMLGAALLSTITGGQVGEELGWRGYALPRIAIALGMRGAAVVVGVIWAAWHLPLFFLFPDADTWHQSFILYAMNVIPLSVAIAWLWLKTGGSLLLTMLMHAAVNNTKDIVPSAPAETAGVWSLHGSPTWWITIGLLWASATILIARMPGKPTESQPAP